MVQPLGNGRLEAGFLVVLVQTPILQSPLVLIVLARVLVPPGALLIAVHVRGRQFRQRHLKLGAGVAQQPQLLSIGQDYGRVVWKLHIRPS